MDETDLPCKETRRNCKTKYLHQVTDTTYIFVFHNCELYVKRTGLIFFQNHKQMSQSHADSFRFFFFNASLCYYASNISHNTYRLKPVHFTEFVYYT